MSNYKREWKIEDEGEFVYITLTKSALDDEPKLSLSRTDKVSPHLIMKLIPTLEAVLESIE